MAIFLLAMACAAPAWGNADGPLRVARVTCGAAAVTAVEIALSREVHVFAPAGPVQADVVINGGLFDGRERPMGPARSAGSDLRRSRRTACEGILAAASGRVELRFSCAPKKWMTDIVSGFPALVRGGRALPVKCRDQICRGVERRSAVGLAPGRLLLVAADEPGLSLQDLAGLLVQLGARDALNLDGGGSTALTVNGAVRVEGRIAAPHHLAIAASRNSPEEKNATGH